MYCWPGCDLDHTTIGPVSLNLSTQLPSSMPNQLTCLTVNNHEVHKSSFRSARRDNYFEFSLRSDSADMVATDTRH